MTDEALVFAGIIVGLAVADLLISLHRLLKRRRQVTWDPLPLWVAGLVLVTLVQVWWSMAGGHATPLQIGDFLPMLAGLIFLFLLAAAALPDNDDPARLDLAEYYAEHRPYIWSLYALALVSMLGVRLSGHAVATDLTAYDTPIQLAVLGAMVSLIFVGNRWWQMAVLAALTLAGPIRWLSRSLG